MGGTSFTVIENTITIDCTGVAYEITDGVYDTPNRSMCSGVIVMRNGGKTLCRGYWGDIVCSPYITHGVQCDLTAMYEVSYGNG